MAGTCWRSFHGPWYGFDHIELCRNHADESHAGQHYGVWLEEQGYEYDMISDLDLHRDPSILRDYPVFMVVGHNEYWSLPMYRGTDDYLRRGGNLVVLSGNAVFWRVSFNEDCSVMECRKADAAAMNPAVSAGRIAAASNVTSVSRRLRSGQSSIAITEPRSAILAMPLAKLTSAALLNPAGRLPDTRAAAPPIQTMRPPPACRR